MAIVIPFDRTASAAAAKPGLALADERGEEDPAQDGAHWARLMVQAQDGDRAAYHVLLKSLTPYVRAIARRYLGRNEDAEDAVQDVLMIVHGIRHTYERGRPFKPWLGTIASRRCIDLLRRRTHRLQHRMQAGFDADDELAATTRAPEDVVELQQATSALHRAVAGLPERQREAVRLLRMRELSLDEASGHSRQSTGSLKVACHRAIKSLQRTLAGKTDFHD